MFSKNKPTDTKEAPKPATSAPAAGAMTDKPVSSPAPASATPASSAPSTPAPSAPKPKPNPSILSSDLVVTGHVKTSGDIQVEGNIEGDIHAHLLTVGENAVVKGEVVADDVVVNGRVIGRVRGIKVRLASTARVEGDIVHKTIAIESGAHFEGSVQRQDDPLNEANNKTKPTIPSGDN
jgi:cytoskeletal protein CcmA (bactofilin family)